MDTTTAPVQVRKPPEVVAQIYEAFGRGDIPFILDQLAPDVSWDEHYRPGIAPILLPGNGRSHVATHFATLLDQAEIREFRVERIVGDDEVAVGVAHLHLVARSTGRSFAGPELHLWRFGPDGKVRAFQHAYDTYQLAGTFTDR